MSRLSFEKQKIGVDLLSQTSRWGSVARTAWFDSGLFGSSDGGAESICIAAARAVGEFASIYGQFFFFPIPPSPLPPDKFFQF